MEPKPIPRLMRGALPAPRTAWIFVVGLIYTGSVVLDVIASSYPPAPSTACTTMQTAIDFGGAAFVLTHVGGFASFIGLVAARGRRWWYLALLALVPILILIVVRSVLWPSRRLEDYSRLSPRSGLLKQVAL